MCRSAVVICLIAAIPLVVQGGGSPEDSLGIRLECVADDEAGPNQQTVAVLGDWPGEPVGPCVRGWYWGVCHDPAAASIGDCAESVTGSFDPCDPWAASPCPSVMCTEDMPWLPWYTGDLDAKVLDIVNLTDHSITQAVLLEAPTVMAPAPPVSGFRMLEIRYTLKAPSAALTFCDQVSEPDYQTSYISGEGQWLKAGTVREITIPCGSQFVRGDANQDGKVNVADAVAVAFGLFGPNQTPPLMAKCWDSGDANDDGRLNVADCVFILQWLFVTGGSLPEPSGSCGYDPTDDEFERCEEFACP